MDQLKSQKNEKICRRRRLHELLIALLENQGELELMDAEAPMFDQVSSNGVSHDPAQWLERNRRLLKQYQSLVRSAITLDALLDAELSNIG